MTRLPTLPQPGRENRPFSLDAFNSFFDQQAELQQQDAQLASQSLDAMNKFFNEQEKMREAENERANRRLEAITRNPASAAAGKIAMPDPTTGMTKWEEDLTPAERFAGALAALDQRHGKLKEAREEKEKFAASVPPLLKPVHWMAQFFKPFVPKPFAEGGTTSDWLPVYGQIKAAIESGQTDPTRNPQWFLRALPAVGKGFRGITAVEAVASANRIKAGTATTDDYYKLAYITREAARTTDQPFWEFVRDMTVDIFGFAAEMALSSPAAAVGGKFAISKAEAAMNKMVGKVAADATASLARRATVKTAELTGRALGRFAGPAMWPGMASNIAERMVKTYGAYQDQRGELQLMLTNEGDSLAAAIPKGLFDSFVENFTEETGFLAGKVTGRITAKVLKETPELLRAANMTATAALFRRWSLKYTGGTPSQFAQMMRQAAKEGSIDSFLGEILVEERLGEIMRAPVEGLQGVTGAITKGDWAEAGKQLAAEAISFAPLTGIGGSARVAQMYAAVPTEIELKYRKDVVIPRIREARKQEFPQAVNEGIRNTFESDPAALGQWLKENPEAYKQLKRSAEQNEGTPARNAWIQYGPAYRANQEQRRKFIELAGGIANAQQVEETAQRDAGGGPRQEQPGDTEVGGPGVRGGRQEGREVQEEGVPQQEVTPEPLPAAPAPPAASEFPATEPGAAFTPDQQQQIDEFDRQLEEANDQLDQKGISKEETKRLDDLIATLDHERRKLIGKFKKQQQPQKPPQPSPTPPTTSTSGQTSPTRGPLYESDLDAYEKTSPGEQVRGTYWNEEEHGKATDDFGKSLRDGDIIENPSGVQWMVDGDFLVMLDDDGKPTDALARLRQRTKADRDAGRPSQYRPSNDARQAIARGRLVQRPAPPLTSPTPGPSTREEATAAKGKRWIEDAVRRRPENVDTPQQIAAWIRKGFSPENFRDYLKTSGKSLEQAVAESLHPGAVVTPENVLTTKEPAKPTKPADLRRADELTAKPTLAELESLEEQQKHITGISFDEVRKLTGLEKGSPALHVIGLPRESDPQIGDTVQVPKNPKGVSALTKSKVESEVVTGVVRRVWRTATQKAPDGELHLVLYVRRTGEQISVNGKEAERYKKVAGAKAEPSTSVEMEEIRDILDRYDKGEDNLTEQDAIEAIYDAAESDEIKDIAEKALDSVEEDLKEWGGRGGSEEELEAALEKIRKLVEAKPSKEAVRPGKQAPAAKPPAKPTLAESNPDAMIGKLADEFFPNKDRFTEEEQWEIANLISSWEEEEGNRKSRAVILERAKDWLAKIRERSATEPEVISVDSLQKYFGLTVDQAVAAMALVDAMGLDRSKIKITKGGEISPDALLQLSEAKEWLKKHYPIPTRSAEEFFNRRMMKALRAVGTPIKGLTKAKNISRKAVEVAAAKFMDDIEDFKKNNKQFADYYGKDLIIQQAALAKVFPELADTSNFLLYQVLNGMVSGGTLLSLNATESIDAWNRLRTHGKMVGVKQKGNAVQWKNQLMNYHLINTLVASMTPAEVINWLITPIHHNDLRYRAGREFGRGEKDGKQMKEIRDIVLNATGQNEMIPRAFMMGPKIGSYVMNLVGFQKFHTIDVWETRVGRSYFKELLKDKFLKWVKVWDKKEEQWKDQLVDRSISDDPIIYKQLLQAWADRTSELAGLAPSEMQAIRWFWYKRLVHEAGYRSKGLLEGTLAQEHKRKLADFVRDNGQPPKKVHRVLRIGGAKTKRNMVALGQIVLKLNNQDPIGANTLFQEGSSLWYSPAREAIERLPSDKAPVTLAYLKKQGVKDEQILWTGLDILLGGNRVTKAQALAHLDKTDVQIKEVVTGKFDPDKVVEWVSRYDNNPLTVDQVTPGGEYQVIVAGDRLPGFYSVDKEGGVTARVFGDTYTWPNIQAAHQAVVNRIDRNTLTGAQYSSYVLPGGENYREFLLTLPARGQEIDFESWLESQGYGDDIDIDILENLRETYERKFESDVFTSRHFGGVKNIVVHVRFNERIDADGKRTLFIEEIQSDWHQQGRKHGYKKTSPDKRQQLVDELEQWTRKNKLPFISADLLVFRDDLTAEQTRWLDDYNARWDAVAGDDRVPEAPYKKSWPMLAMRRMIRWAAENGFDQVAWTTGEQQAERYDLSTVVDKIFVSPVGADKKAVDIEPLDGGSIELIVDANGKVQDTSVDAPDEFIGKGLDDIVGKEVADKIMSMDKGTIQGEDLKIGSPGMRSFYDKMLVSETNKFIKKFGGRVGVAAIETVAGGGIGAYRGEDFAIERDEATGTYAIYDTELDEPVIENLASREEAVYAMSGIYIIVDSRGENIGEGPWLDEDEAKEFLNAEVGEPGARVVTLGAGQTKKVHAFSITPSMRKSAMEGVSLFQSKKASVEFTDAGEAIIRALENPDVSSIAHELAHIARRFVLNREVPEDQRAGITNEDIEVVEKWAGAKDGKWDRKAEERLARGFERYLYDGQAPAPQLKSVFEKISAWLKQIYRKIVGSAINVKISPAMREVFDKLVTRGVEKVEAKPLAELTRQRTTTPGLTDDLRKRADEAEAAWDESRKAVNKAYAAYENTRAGTKKKDQLKAKWEKAKAAEQEALEKYDQLRHQWAAHSLEDAAEQTENEILAIAARHELQSQGLTGQEALNLHQQAYDQIKARLQAMRDEAAAQEKEFKLPAEDDQEVLDSATEDMTREFLRNPLLADKPKDKLLDQFTGRIRGARLQRMRTRALQELEEIAPKVGGFDRRILESYDAKKIDDILKSARGAKQDEQRQEEAAKETAAKEFEGQVASAEGIPEEEETPERKARRVEQLKERRFWERIKKVGRSTPITGSQKIVIRSEKGAELEIEAEMVGKYLAIHPVYDFDSGLPATEKDAGWVLTHVPSYGGLAYAKKDDALGALAILKEFGLDLDQKELPSLAKARSIQQAWDEGDLGVLDEELRQQALDSVPMSETDLGTDHQVRLIDLPETVIPIYRGDKQVGTITTLKLVQQLAAGNPAFRFDPVFTVVKRLRRKAATKKNPRPMVMVLAWRERIFYLPKHFGLDPRELKEGDTVGLDLADMGIKLLDAESVVREVLGDQGFDIAKKKGKLEVTRATKKSQQGPPQAPTLKQGSKELQDIRRELGVPLSREKAPAAKNLTPKEETWTEYTAPRKRATIIVEGDGIQWQVTGFRNADSPEDPDIKAVRDALAQIPWTEKADVSQADILFSRGSTNMPRNMLYDGVSIETPMSRDEFIRNLERRFDIPIREGRTAPAGMYNVLQELIRLHGAFAQNLAVATHEVAHHIDKMIGLLGAIAGDVQNQQLRTALRQLDYIPNRKEKTKGVQEGFAEFVRMWVTHDRPPISTAYSLVVDWFENRFLPNHPELKRQMLETREDYKQWSLQPVKQRNLAEIQDERIRDFDDDLLSGMDRFVANMKDKGYAFLVAQREMERRKGVTLVPGKDPYSLFWTAPFRTRAEAEHALVGRGISTLTEDFRVIGPSLAERLKGLKSEDVDEFLLYAIAVHVLDVASKKPKVNMGMSREDAEVIANAIQGGDKFALFEDKRKKLVSYFNDLLKFAVDSGILTERERQIMMKWWGKTYIPVERAQKQRRFGNRTPGMGALNLGKAVMRRFGSDLPIRNPLHVAVERTKRFYDHAMKQQVLLSARAAFKEEGGGRWMSDVKPNVIMHRIRYIELAKQIVQEGFLTEDEAEAIKIAHKIRHFGNLVDQSERDWLSTFLGVSDADLDDAIDREGEETYVPKMETVFALWKPDYSPDPKHYIARSVIDGKIVMTQWHPDLYRALASMDPKAYNIFTRFMSGAQKLTKMGWVSLSATFGAANIPRDFLFFQHTTAEVEGLKSVSAPLRWLMLYVTAAVAGRENEVVDLYNEMGGSFTTKLGMDKTSMRRWEGELVEQSKGQRFKQALVSPALTMHRAADAYRDLLSFSEMGPRLAEFHAALARQGWEWDPKTNQMIDRDTGDPGRPPRHVLVHAFMQAQDVTTFFGRTGYWGQEIDRYLTFFNANIEGKSKVIRALIKAVRESKSPSEILTNRVWVAMGTMAAATLIYWWFRKDDDDYKAEEDWLRNYWTFAWNKKPIMRVPRPFDWNVFTNFVEAVANHYYQEDPDEFKRFAKEIGLQQLPNFNVPVITPSLEAFFNYDFFKLRPIDSPNVAVLPEDRKDPWTLWTSEQLGKITGMSPRRLEHWLNGMTGDLYRKVQDIPLMFARAFQGELAAADIPGVKAYAIRKDYVRAIQDFYDQYKRLEMEAGSARQRGEMEHPSIKEHGIFEDYSKFMTTLRQGIKDVRDRDERFESEKFIAGLAREALGLVPLDRYPSPYKDMESLPDAAREEAYRIVASHAERIVGNVPKSITKLEKEKGLTVQDKQRQFATQRNESQEWLRERGLSVSQVADIYAKSLEGKFSPATVQAKVSKFRAAMLPTANLSKMDAPSILEDLAKPRPMALTKDQREMGYQLSDLQAQWDQQADAARQWLEQHGITNQEALEIYNQNLVERKVPAKTRVDRIRALRWSLR